MQEFFVALQGSYGNLELVLIDVSFKSIDFISCNDQKASSHLISHLSHLLSRNNLKLNDILFIAVDCGPGAFTSLRVIISTVNGLSFASKIPLIGVSGLQALCEQSLFALNAQKKLNVSHVACLLNAYNNDVYTLVRKVYFSEQEDAYRFIDEGVEVCQKIDIVLENLMNMKESQNIFFNGNAVVLHEKLILDVLKERALINSPVDMSCSASHVGSIAFECWKNKKNIVTKIIPNYLKTQNFAIKNNLLSPK